MKFGRLWRSALPIAVTAASVLALLVVAGPANADPGPDSASGLARYECGSQCNGKQPNWVIPSNGVQCVNSQALIASGHPAHFYSSPVDYSVTVHVYYSSVCQTMWETVSRTTSTTDFLCGYRLNRTVSPTYDTSGPCPDPGHSLTTPMMDDANNGNIAGYVNVITQWYIGTQGWGGVFQKSY